MTTDDLSAFSTAQIAALSSAQFVAITTDQISHLTTTDLAALTTAEVHAFTTDQINAITTDQVQALTTTDLATLDMTQVQAFSPLVAHMTDAQVAALLYVSPIVLDLTGNGISTTSAAQGVNFDLTGTGHSAKVGWTSANEGLLAIDLNHNGVIDNGSELFGSGMIMANGTRAANGYQAMAQYDTNGDGKLDAGDAQFKDLRVWVDANHDGKTEAGELKTLAELGITSIDLHGLAGNTVNNGNLLGMTSTYTTTSGATHAVADVWFAKDTSQVQDPTHATATVATAAVPNLSDLLAAPATDLLPGHVADTASKAHVESSSSHGLMDNRLLGDEEQHRHNPLI
jgi:hypothetical protein